jgi:hypothetical protein
LDLHQSLALKEVSSSKLDALHEFAASTSLSLAEKTALTYARCIWRRASPPSAISSELKLHFNEQQIIDINWLCAYITYLNMLATGQGIGSDGFCALHTAGRKAA